MMHGIHICYMTIDFLVTKNSLCMWWYVLEYKDKKVTYLVRTLLAFKISVFSKTGMDVRSYCRNNERHCYVKYQDDEFYIYHLTFSNIEDALNYIILIMGV